MTAYSLAELESFTRADLLAVYNQFADRPLKSFKDHATAVKRTAILLGVLDADEDAQEEAEEPVEQVAATHAEAPAESEPAAILAASAEDDIGPMCSALMDTSADDEEKAAIRAAKAEAKYSPTNPDNIARAAFYNFTSVEAYIAAIRAKHTYKKAVTAGADNVAELKARWQAAERSGKAGKKVKVA